MNTLKEFIDIVTANSEEDVNKLLTILNPTTEQEMSPVYEEVLGYNPIYYFDRKTAEDFVDRIIPLAPIQAAQILKDKKEEIIDSSIRIFKDGRQNFVEGIVEEVVRNVIPVDIWDDDEMYDAFDKEACDTKYDDEDDDDDEYEDSMSDEYDDDDDGFDESYSDEEDD